MVVTRHTHAIRERPDHTVWFSSASQDLLPSPIPTPNSPEDGHLYVHTASGGRRQVWMWLKGEWHSVEIHHPHPRLSGYVLNMLSNGEPSWVKSETVHTYQGHAKRREREQISQSQNWCVIVHCHLSSTN